MNSKLKNTITEIRGSMDGFNIRMQGTEQTIYKQEVTTQQKPPNLKTHREVHSFKKRKNEHILNTLWDYNKNITFMSDD